MVNPYLNCARNVAQRQFYKSNTPVKAPQYLCVVTGSLHHKEHRGILHGGLPPPPHPEMILIRLIAEELHVKESMSVMDKGELKKTIDEELKTKIEDEIEHESENKTKVKHWREMKNEIIIGRRPKYMEDLNRKQCSIIMNVRSSMLHVKVNKPIGHNTSLMCRYCTADLETRKHVIQE